MLAVGVWYHIFGASDTVSTLSRVALSGGDKRPDLPVAVIFRASIQITCNRNSVGSAVYG